MGAAAVTPISPYPDESGGGSDAHYFDAGLGRRNIRIIAAHDTARHE
jgi:hypothetical protein